ncbi:Glycoside hydrolase family 105 protein [Pyrenophora tritici-repentis]|nr:Glycoside hydrolase family 105 protein [Pyrenophora tritici-repentis]
MHLPLALVVTLATSTLAIPAPTPVPTPDSSSPRAALRGSARNVYLTTCTTRSLSADSTSSSAILYNSGDTSSSNPSDVGTVLSESAIQWAGYTRRVPLGSGIFESKIDKGAETLEKSQIAGSAKLRPKNTTRPYSTWMAHSFRSKNQTIDNHYVSAVIHEGYAKAAMAQNDTELAAFAAGEVSSIVSANGTLKGWNSTFYTLDDIRIGNNLLHVWNSEGRKDNKYVIAAKGLREQLNRWPRTPEGGFWHRAPTYENQMWLDGLYMADTFYATYTSYFEPENTTAWNEIELQFDQIEEHCRNKTSNLLKHGFSSDKSTVWADPITGASPYVWDRALGWYFVALVEVLEVWPKTHAGYSKLLNYYTTLASGIKDVQDISGGWWLLMDEQLAGLTGNYIESSATALFTYSYLKGVRLGLLEQAYQDTAVKAWDLLLDEFIQYEQNGTLSFTGTVTVGSLKGDASYEYYTTVPLLVNDGKGAGPFMYAASEIELACLD